MKAGWTQSPQARAWRFRASQLGWPAWAGLAAMLAAVALGPLVIDPMRQEAAAWDAQAQRAQRERATRPPDPAQAAQRQGQDFVATLPTGDAALAAVQDLHRLAQRHGVVLASGEYRLIDEASGRWQRYQITLPAQASDMSLRLWMAEALNRWPSLALDDWSATRDRAGQELVQARVRWSFYLRAPS